VRALYLLKHREVVALLYLIATIVLEVLAVLAEEALPVLLVALEIVFEVICCDLR